MPNGATCYDRQVSTDATALPPIAVWQEQRRQLTALAYRMLGSWSDAEDAVAEVGAQLAALDAHAADVVQSWPAMLRTMTTRRAVDQLRSATRRRVEYPGEWLPEPIDTALLPDEEAEERELLELGVLHLMEVLSPEARAAYVLRHALQLPYAEIAQILELTTASARQLVSRAQRKIGEPPTRRADTESQRRYAYQLLEAIASGEVARVAALLHDEVSLHSDGGGHLSAARRPILGAEKVARFLIGTSAKHPDRTVFELALNGGFALLFEAPQRQDVVFFAQVHDGGQRVLIVCNPEKLGHLPTHRQVTVIQAGAEHG